MRHACRVRYPRPKPRIASMIGSLLDTILNRTVLAGYTRVGYRMRRGTWSTAEMQPMGEKVVLVTGGTSGLGLAAAEGFARLGATVWLPARSQQRGELARAQIVASSPGSNVRVGLCDLSDLESVRQFAERLGGETGRLDVLVNNAGALASERTLSVDRIELTLQMGHEEFDGPTAYARTKRAQIILTELWAERLQDTGLVVHAMHPGWVDTPGLKSSLPRFYGLTKPLLRTPQEGADTILWLGAAPEPARSSGGFWHDRRERPTHRTRSTKQTPQDHERLWTECERLSDWHDTPAPAESDRRGHTNHIRR
jgi:dehydrogenase/reductase SDR family protein 12